MAGNRSWQNTLEVVKVMIDKENLEAEKIREITMPA